MSQADYDAEYAKCMHSFKRQEKNRSRNFVYCKVCHKFPEIVRMFTENNKIASITTENGTRYRKDTVENHFISVYHAKCKEAELLASVPVPVNKPGLIDTHISEANRKRANHIGKLFLQVYTDAKKLTSSAYSWPARFIGSEVASRFDFNSDTNTIPSDINIQYVNPSSHLDLLKIIVQSHQKEFKQKIETASAFSIHIDGSVDRTQIDKIYILLKIVTTTCDLETIFIGIGQKMKGLFEATKKGIIDNFGEEVYAMIMSRVSSICTDGENQNTGEKHSLWVLFEEECKRYRNDLPLIKLWCSAHRLELVWNDLTQRVPEVKSVLSIMSSISSHFRESGLRTEELKQIAAENQLKLLSIPKIFKIRWTEWTHKTIENVLKSWNAIMKYCESSENATATGFATFLSNFENLKLIAFLADLLQIYQRYHKNVQGDKLTIVSLAKYINALKASLQQLQNDDIIGGWAERLQSDVIIEQEKVLLKGIEFI